MIAIIVALAQNNAIGFENKLLYWLPDDLKRFKTLTSGHTIIMGRKTYESLPKGALPNRRNVVLSRTIETPYENTEIFESLEKALASCQKEEAVFIIGGETLYRKALPFADKLYITAIEDTPKQADAFFPQFDTNEWNVSFKETHEKDEKHAFRFHFIDYERHP